MDSQAAEMILSAIQEVGRNTTNLVIAHRLSTIVNADQIIVLDQGQIVERGHHQALLSANGAYAELWTAQQKEMVG